MRIYLWKCDTFMAVAWAASREEARRLTVDEAEETAEYLGIITEPVYAAALNTILNLEPTQFRRPETVPNAVFTLTTSGALKRLADMEDGHAKENILLREALKRAELPHAKGCAIAASRPCNCGLEAALND